MANFVTNLVNRVERYCLAERLLVASETVLLAVSGGSDSTALLVIFDALRERFGLRLHVGHLNHCLRGSESDADAAFVVALAERFGVPATVGAVDVAARRAAQGGSLEAVAREVRYDFLDSTARAVGATKIALAHHREDVAETFLLHLLRGAGSGGLGSIRPIRDGRWIRPLLLMSKSELVQFLATRNEPHREDASNGDRRFLRNRVRHELLPTLADYNPRVVDALVRAAATLADEDAYLETAALDLLRVLERNGGLDVAGLKGAPVALQRRAVQRWLNDRLPPERAATFAEVESVCGFVTDATRSLLTLRRQFAVASDDGVLRVARADTEPTGAAAPLRVPGETVADGVALGVSARLVPAAEWANRSLAQNEAAFDFERVPKPLALRTWRAGDRFQPFGMAGAKRVSRLLQDEKVRANERRGIGVVLGGSEVLWVAGLRADGRYPVTDRTATALHLTAYDPMETRSCLSIES